MGEITPYSIFEVFEEQRGRRTILYTRSAYGPESVYGEKIVQDGKMIYREWVPEKSKLASTILKGAPNIFIRKNDMVLYLGSSTGTTVSHVSDIVGPKGVVFAVDIAPIVLRELVFLAEERSNIIPLLVDAAHPEELLPYVCLVDVVYQDVAQKNQVEIFLKNTKQFLKPGGYGLLAVKARSIDVGKNPRAIFNQVFTELERNNIKIIDKRMLDPFQKDHMMFICKF